MSLRYSSEYITSGYQLAWFFTFYDIYCKQSNNAFPYDQPMKLSLFLVHCVFYFKQYAIYNIRIRDFSILLYNYQFLIPNSN